MKMRKEKDLLGEKEISGEVYWGIHTARALENFNMSSNRISFELIRAMVFVKKAACQANCELGYLTKEKSNAIISGCDEILGGRYVDQFPLDTLQGGAGTSTNMNVNEVVANRAIEILGGTKGDYSIVHPIEDVNKHQSTNDVYPTALKVAAIFQLRKLSDEIAKLQGAFQQKEKEFSHVVKLGRTELQEAVPMTLGAEFSAFAEAFGRDRWRTFKCEERLRTVNIGGTAIGTGLGAPQKYIFLVIEKLKLLTGLGLSRGENVIDQTANADAFVEVSGILKAHASNLIKVSNDLRLMNLLGEIKLPKFQAGSSIMPGKVNPVVLEAVIQAGLKAAANDGLVFEAASRGSLQINEFMPLLAHALLETLELLINVSRMLVELVVRIEANEEICNSFVEQSETIITAFVPEIGYERAELILKEFKELSEKNFRRFLEKKLGKELVDRVLSPQNLLALGYREHGKNT